MSGRFAFLTQIGSQLGIWLAVVIATILTLYFTGLGVSDWGYWLTLGVEMAVLYTVGFRFWARTQARRRRRSEPLP